MKMEEGLLKALVGKKMGTERLLKGSKEKMDVFSYHYYNGVSERITAGLHFTQTAIYAFIVHFHLLPLFYKRTGARLCCKLKIFFDNSQSRLNSERIIIA